jgi:hypothetical protein
MISRLIALIASLTIAAVSSLSAALPAPPPHLTVTARLGSASTLPAIPTSLSITVHNDGTSIAYYIPDVVYEVTPSGRPAFPARTADRGIFVDPLAEYYDPEEESMVRTLASGQTCNLHIPVGVNMAGPTLFCDQRTLEPGVYMIRVGLETVRSAVPPVRIVGWGKKVDPFGENVVWSDPVTLRVIDPTGDDADALLLVRNAIESAGDIFTACSWVGRAGKKASIEIFERYPTSAYAAVTADLAGSGPSDHQINRVTSAASQAPTIEWRETLTLRAAGLRIEKAWLLSSTDPQRASLFRKAAADARSVIDRTADDHTKVRARSLIALTEADRLNATP